MATNVGPCQLHIPHKDDQSPQMMRENWSSIERWVNERFPGCVGHAFTESWLTGTLTADVTNPNTDLSFTAFGQAGTDITLTSPTVQTINATGWYSCALQYSLRPTTDFAGVVQFQIITPGPSPGDPDGPLTDWFDCIAQVIATPTGQTDRYRDFNTLPTTHFTAGDQISWGATTIVHAGSVVAEISNTQFAISRCG